MVRKGAGWLAVGPVAAAGVAFTFGLALAPGAAAESGRGAVGGWDVIWNHSELEGYQNRFTETVGNGAVFPIPWRRLGGLSGNRLVFFSADGGIEEEIPLGPEEQATAAEDGSAYLVWSPDSASTDAQVFRYHRRGQDAPEWEATAAGEPALFAPDGGLFVIASRSQRRDQFSRLVNETRGQLQVVGASGDIRGDLPVFPMFSELSEDQRLIVFLHNGQVIALGRDGRLAWEREVPIDALVRRDGVPQLATGGDLVVVCGTGALPGKSAAALHPERRGYVLAMDTKGRVQWQHKQPRDEELWFQVSTAVAPDGSTVVTCHGLANAVVVRAWNGASGDLLWTQTERREGGFRAVNVTDGGRRILLAQCGERTNVIAWDREGTVIFDAALPMRSRSVLLTQDDLLVAESWIAALEMEEPEF